MKRNNIKPKFFNPKVAKDIGIKCVLIAALSSLALTGCSTGDSGNADNSNVDAIASISDNNTDLTDFKKDIYVDISGIEYSSSSDENDYIMFIGTDRLLLGIYPIEDDTEKSNVYNVRADVTSIYSINMDMEVELPRIELDEHYRILLDYTNKKIDISVEKART